MRRILAAGVALAGLVVVPLAVPTIAAAAEANGTGYPPEPVEMLVVDSSTVEPGQTFTITGDGYDPGEKVTIAITAVHHGLRADSAALWQPTLAPEALQRPALAREAPEPDFTAPHLAPVKATTDGTIHLRLSLDQPGTWQIVAVGATSGHVQSVTTIVRGEQTTSADVASGVDVDNTGGFGGALEYTGVNHPFLVLGTILALIAVVIGAGLVWLGRTARRTGPGLDDGPSGETA